MSYLLIKSRARTRFSENLAYLNFLTSIEPTDVTIQANLELKVMKGLFYVHLYSSFEKTINDLIENTITYINSENIKNKHFNFPFNTISLSNKLKAFKACGYNSFFAKAIEIFEELSSDNIISLNETTFASNLQNVWAKTIIEMLNAFGIKSFTINARTRVTIDEIVEKRNAVAHGRESASVVGERFRTDALRTKMQVITTFTYDLIDTLESFHANKMYIKPQAKRYYTGTP